MRRDGPETFIEEEGEENRIKIVDKYVEFVARGEVRDVGFRRDVLPPYVRTQRGIDAVEHVHHP